MMAVLPPSTALYTTFFSFPPINANNWKAELHPCPNPTSAHRSIYKEKYKVLQSTLALMLGNRRSH